MARQKLFYALLPSICRQRKLSNGDSLLPLENEVTCQCVGRLRWRLAGISINGSESLAAMLHAALRREQNAAPKSPFLLCAWQSCPNWVLPCIPLGGLQRNDPHANPWQRIKMAARGIFEIGLRCILELTGATIWPLRHKRGSLRVNKIAFVRRAAPSDSIRKTLTGCKHVKTLQHVHGTTKFLQRKVICLSTLGLKHHFSRTLWHLCVDLAPNCNSLWVLEQPVKA